MTYRTLLPGVVFACTLAVSACTWVKLDPGAENIRVVDEAAVAGCERLGQTTTEVRARVGAVQRKPGKVEEELSVLARNSALDMGGDSLVPLGPVSADGKRSYAVYRCLPVRG